MIFRNIFTAFCVSVAASGLLPKADKAYGYGYSDQHHWSYQTTADHCSSTSHPQVHSCGPTIEEMDLLGYLLLAKFTVAI